METHDNDGAPTEADRLPAGPRERAWEKARAEERAQADALARVQETVQARHKRRFLAWKRGEVVPAQERSGQRSTAAPARQRPRWQTYRPAARLSEEDAARASVAPTPPKPPVIPPQPAGSTLNDDQWLAAWRHAGRLRYVQHVNRKLPGMLYPPRVVDPMPFGAVVWELDLDAGYPQHAAAAPVAVVFTRSGKSPRPARAQAADVALNNNAVSRELPVLVGFGTGGAAAVAALETVELPIGGVGVADALGLGLALPVVGGLVGLHIITRRRDARVLDADADVGRTAWDAAVLGQVAELGAVLTVPDHGRHPDSLSLLRDTMWEADEVGPERTAERIAALHTTLVTSHRLGLVAVGRETYRSARRRRQSKPRPLALTEVTEASDDLDPRIHDLRRHQGERARERATREDDWPEDGASE